MPENSRVAWRSKRSGRTRASVKERNTKLSMIAAVAVVSLASAAAVTAQQVVVEPTVTVGRTEPTPTQKPGACAQGSVRCVGTGQAPCCKEQDKAAQQSCMTPARDDYHRMMSSARTH